MKYTVTKSVVQVIGTIWLPTVTAALDYTLDGFDVENLKEGSESGEVTRESVQDWLDTHAGDFCEVTDFYASIEDGDETIEIPWQDEESELTYNDCMWGSEDE
jgi:hypothetical protein